MSNFNIRKFLTENSLTQASRLLNESPSDRVTNTVWTRQGGDPVDDPFKGDGIYIPTVTYNGKEYTLDYHDYEEGDDRGTILAIYTTDELPGYEFSILAADYGPQNVFDPRYYDENDWDVLTPSLDEGFSTKPKVGKTYVDDDGDTWKVTKISGNKVHLTNTEDNSETIFPDDFDEGRFGDWFDEE